MNILHNFHALYSFLSVFSGISGPDSVRRNCPGTSEPLHAGNASLSHILIDAALGNAPFIRCFPDGKTALHAYPPLITILQKNSLHYIRMTADFLNRLHRVFRNRTLSGKDRETDSPEPQAGPPYIRIRPSFIRSGSCS